MISFFKRVLFIILISSPLISSSQVALVDSLKQKLQHTSNLEIKSELCLNIIREYESELDSAITYYSMAVELLKSSLDQNLKTRLEIYMGNAYLNSKEFKKSKVNFDTALENAKSQNNKLHTSLAYFHISYWYYMLSNLKEALVFSQKGMRVLEEEIIKTPDDKEILFQVGYGTNLSGMINVELKNYPQALEDYKKALDISQQLKQDINIAYSRNNIAHVYLKLKNYKNALSYIENLNLENPDYGNRLKSLLYGNLGNAQIGLGDIEQGFNSLEKSLQLANKMNNPRLQIITLEIISSRFNEQGKFEEAIQSATNGVKIAQEADLDKYLPNLFETIATAHKNKGRFKEAMSWMEKNKEAQLELSKKQNKEEVIMLTALHQSKQQKVENEILKIKNRNNRILIYLLLAISVIVILSTIFLLNQRHKQRLLKFKNKLAADLHDEVGSNLNNIAHIAKNLKGEIPTENDLSQKVDLLVNNSNLAIKGVVDTLWTMDTQEAELIYLIDKMNDHLNIFQQTNPNAKITFEQDLKLENQKLKMITRHNILMIFKEALNNIQKHTIPTNIYITVGNSKKSFELKIINEYKEKIKFNHRSGYGLGNMKRRVNELNGNIKILDETFKFTIDISIENKYM